MTAPEIIKLCRKKLGLTQTQYADVTGFHVNSIRRWELNRSQPTFDNVMMLLAHAGIKLSEVE